VFLFCALFPAASVIPFCDTYAAQNDGIVTRNCSSSLALLSMGRSGGQQNSQRQVKTCHKSEKMGLERSCNVVCKRKQSCGLSFRVQYVYVTCESELLGFLDCFAHLGGFGFITLLAASAGHCARKLHGPQRYHRCFVRVRQIADATDHPVSAC
jgi:hypothetical protein